MNLIKDKFLWLVLIVFGILALAFVNARSQDISNVEGEYILLVQKEPIVNGEYNTNAYGPMNFDKCDAIAKAVFVNKVPGYASLVCTSLEAFNNSAMVLEHGMKLEDLHVFELELEELDLPEEPASKGLDAFLDKMPFLTPAVTP